MKITREKIENSQAFLTIEMEPSEVETALEKAYGRLVKKTNVPGFRKGKAPRPVLERFVGKDRLFENALDTLIPDAYEKALKEQEIEAFAQPQIEVTQTEPLIFKAVVPLKPRVKLGDYHHLNVEHQAVREVPDAEIDAIVTELRQQHASYDSIELRSADFGDMLIIDVAGTMGEQPVPEQKRTIYRLRQDTPLPLPGFPDQLRGMKKGETKEFKIPIPDNYPVTDLAGKEASFKITVHDISQEILPPLDDEFARMIKPDFNALSDLRQFIKDDLISKEQEQTDHKFEDKVLGMVVGLSEIEFPPVLVETEVNRLINQRFPGGREQMDTYLKRINKTPEAYHEGLHHFAANQLKQSLVLGKIAEEEKIEVSDPAIDAEIENAVATIEANQQLEARTAFNNPKNRDIIKNKMLTTQTLLRLVEIVKANTAAATDKEATASPDEEKGTAPAKEKKTTHKKEKNKEEKNS